MLHARPAWHQQEKSMKVEKYMSTDVVTANPKDGLRQTFYRMRERGIRHMPVLGDDDRLAGIVSERDLRRPDWVDSEENVAHYYLLDNAHKVEETMTRDPEVVRPGDDIQRAVGIIVERRFGALPVVDEAGRLAGMISAIDLLRAFHDTAEG
jgi:acetoin utilization protein AcuB